MNRDEFWLELVPILDRFKISYEFKSFNFNGNQYSISESLLSEHKGEFYLYQIVDCPETMQFSGYSVTKQSIYHFVVQYVNTPQDVESFIIENIIG